MRLGVLSKKPLVKSKKSKRAKVLSIIGVEGNVGVTHFALMAANYLAKKRYKIGYFECNNSGDLQKVECLYEGDGHDGYSTRTFKIRGVTYHKQLGEKELTSLYQLPYDFIILDIGKNIGTFGEEVLRSDHLYVIGHYNDWKEEVFNTFIEVKKDWLIPRTTMLIRFGDEEELKSLKIVSGYESLCIPYQKDPFIRKKENKNAMMKILGV